MLKYQVTLYILGISQIDNYYSIEKKITGLGGIISIKGSLPKGKIVIEFKPNFVSTKEIVNIIENLGFAVVKNIQREYCFDKYN